MFNSFRISVFAFVHAVILQIIVNKYIKDFNENVWIWHANLVDGFFFFFEMYI